MLRTATLLLFCLAAVAAGRPPNIVLLIADDLGYGETGMQGNPEIPTPHIDRLAAGGVRFTNGYVTASFCSASRAGLITGRYQNRFGYELNPIGHRNEDPAIGLPQNQKTIAEALHDAGYATGLIGKWHLGGTAAFHPQRHGFDEFFGFMHEGHYFVPPPWKGMTTMLRRRTLPGGGKGRWTNRAGDLVLSTHMGYDEPAYDADNPIERNSQPVNETQYLTDALTREAVDFIDRNHERPFFLTLSWNAVHSPLQAPNSTMERYSHIEDIHRRIFAAMLHHLDESTGQVMQALKRNGLERDTLVVFISDNGGPTRELTSRNAPLRGEKGTVYEGGLRVPFIMHFPGTLSAGKVDDRPIISLDIMPTALAAAGAKVPGNLDGVNLLPYLTGEKSGQPHEQLFWRIGNRAALREGDWKLLRNSHNSAGPWELYHLGDDVAESRDLSATEPDRLRAMQARWKKVSSTMAEPAW